MSYWQGLGLSYWQGGTIHGGGLDSYWQGLAEWQQWTLGIGCSLAAAFIVWLFKKFFGRTTGTERAVIIQQNASPVVTQHFQPTINIHAPGAAAPPPPPDSSVYERRLAIYRAFRELLVAVVEKTDVEAELRKASAAQAESQFVLDMQLSGYLEELYKEGFRINENGKLLRNRPFRAAVDSMELGKRTAQLSDDKLALLNRVPELGQHFERFLKLTDSSQ